MKKFLSILLVSIFLFTGCNFSFSIGKDDPTPPINTTEEEANGLPQTFNTPMFGYTFKYPSDWQKQEDVNAYTVLVANGKASIAIQNLASNMIGGEYASVDDVVTSFKAQLDKAENVKLSDEKEFSYVMEDGTELIGKQFVVEYTIPEDNATYKQLQIVLPRKDGQVFHAWSYTSLVENYDQWSEVAAEILASWKIM